MLFNSDKLRYKTTINGIAANQKKKNNIIELIIKIILKVFALDLMGSFLSNLSEKNRIFEIKSMGNKIEVMSKN